MVQPPHWHLGLNRFRQLPMMRQSLDAFNEAKKQDGAHHTEQQTKTPRLSDCE
jgi:hypothetical protein